MEKVQFDATKPVVTCRSAEPPEPIDPTYTLGYSCRLCRKQLQISKDSIATVKAGANTICNSCGAKLLQEMMKRGRGEIYLQPGAQEQIERFEGKPINQVYPHAERRVMDFDVPITNEHPDTCMACGVLLKGAWTAHTPACPLGRLIKAHTK
jgi:hypothetical protein